MTRLRTFRSPADPRSHPISNDEAAEPPRRRRPARLYEVEFFPGDDDGDRMDPATALLGELLLTASLELAIDAARDCFVEKKPVNFGGGCRAS